MNEDILNNASLLAIGVRKHHLSAVLRNEITADHRAAYESDYNTGGQ
jgi:hypothetical protein